jgi:ligand-binding SRPBCC domain-containing protein
MSEYPMQLNKLTTIIIEKKNGLYALETSIRMPHSIDRVFSFFADAGNLETITPPWLQFQILTPLPIALQAGAKIDYRLRLHGVPIRWQTEITAWEPPHRFVDEQRRGPYRIWIHEHTFSKQADGCEMRDFVRYAAFGGPWTNYLFVQRNVRMIFEYRARKLRELFGSGFIRDCATAAQ